MNEKEDICKFITISEIEKSKTPKEIKDSSEAYLKGKMNDNSKTISKKTSELLIPKG